MREQSKEEHCLGQSDIRVRPRIPAADEQRHAGMDEKHHELRQLQLRNVALPPEMLLNGWAHEREEVVEVHDDVHRAVNNNDHDSLTIWSVREPEPTVEDN